MDAHAPLIPAPHAPGSVGGFPEDSAVWRATTADALSTELLRAGCSEENAGDWLVPLMRDWRGVPPHTRRVMNACAHVLACAAALRPTERLATCTAACRNGAANFIRAVNAARPGCLGVHTRAGVFSCAFAANQCGTADGLRAFVHACTASPSCRANAAVVSRFLAVLAHQWALASPRDTCSALVTACCTQHFIMAGLPCMRTLVAMLLDNPAIERRVQRLLTKHKNTPHPTLASAVNTRVLRDALNGCTASSPLPAGWSEAEHAAAVALAAGRS